MPTPEEKWLLQFSSADGAPWGTATYIAKRKAQNQDPWHKGCKVTTLVGGFTAMCAIRDALEDAIHAAKKSPLPVGQRGRVYICDWRMNAFRDLSNGNAWKTGPWAANHVAADDQTAIGLVLRLMQAGVQVRILIWLPPSTPGVGAWHLEDHFYIARVVQAQNARLVDKVSGTFKDATEPIGIVALDRRLASWVTATHHQKMVVIRSPAFDMAFCGGVDLAYTRRDAPPQESPTDSPNSDFPCFYDGDWQSANGVPNPAGRWPSLQDSQAVDYFVRNHIDPPQSRGNDLYTAVYGAERQIWHDQHLQLEGEIVTALEWQFKERWEDPGIPSGIPANPEISENYLHATWGSVFFSTTSAFVTNKDDGVDEQGTKPEAGSVRKGMLAIKPLPGPAPLAKPTPGATTVQMWRTIPFRLARARAYDRQAEQQPDKQAEQHPRDKTLYGGEFTVAAGIANAVAHATNLIWMFDQYFWSLPLARLLNARLQEARSLRLILILPPHADSDMGVVYRAQHRARWLALQTLTSGVKSRVGVYNLWDFRTGCSRGIYCHAKAHTYDGSLFVCGSANLNRRSLTGDSELACAVMDKALVLGHQKKLWSLLFPNTPWPSVNNLDEAGSGNAFFQAFNSAYGAANVSGPNVPLAFVTEDRWTEHGYALPNSVVRDDAADVGFPVTYDHLLESESVDHAKLEVASVVKGRTVEPDLVEVVRRLGIISWRQPPRKGHHNPPDREEPEQQPEAPFEPKFKFKLEIDPYKLLKRDLAEGTYVTFHGTVEIEVAAGPAVESTKSIEVSQEDFEAALKRKWKIEETDLPENSLLLQSLAPIEIEWKTLKLSGDQQTAGPDKSLIALGTELEIKFGEHGVFKTELTAVNLKTDDSGDVKLQGPAIKFQGGFTLEATIDLLDLGVWSIEFEFLPTLEIEPNWKRILAQLGETAPQTAERIVAEYFATEVVGSALEVAVPVGVAFAYVMALYNAYETIKTAEECVALKDAVRPTHERIVQGFMQGLSAPSPHTYFVGKPKPDDATQWGFDRGAERRRKFKDALKHERDVIRSRNPKNSSALNEASVFEGIIDDVIAPRRDQLEAKAREEFKRANKAAEFVWLGFADSHASKDSDDKPRKDKQDMTLYLAAWSTAFSVFPDPTSSDSYPRGKRARQLFSIYFSNSEVRAHVAS